MNTLLTVLACIILAPVALAIVWRVARLVWFVIRIGGLAMQDIWLTSTLPSISEGEVEIFVFAGKSHLLKPRLERGSYGDVWHLDSPAGVSFARCQGYIGKHPAPRKGNRWVWEADR